ncbi:MAG: hypothetical protein AB1502_07555 [Thermodesulfobacteriota bacterium]
MEKEKGKVFLLGAESIGRGDDNLGYQILITMLDSLGRRKDRPSAIICWNTAVKLVAEGSPLVPHFKGLEEKGVDILLGKLCIKEYDLTGKIAVGREATMDEILDLILHREVVNL